MRFASILILMLMAFACALHAQGANEDPFSVGMDAKVTVIERPLGEANDYIDVVAAIENTYKSEQSISLLRQAQDGSWEKVKAVGAVAPGAKANATIRIAVSYPMQTKTKTRYALVATGFDGTKGKYFEVFEDWSAYEASVRSQLAGAVFFVLPIASIGVIILTVALMMVAYKTKVPEAYKGEYNTGTLFAPKMAGRNFGERLADFFMMPAVWLLETACLLVLVFIMYTTLSNTHAEYEVKQIMALSCAGALVMPFLYFAGAWYYNERSEKKPLRLFAAMFFWGIFAAVLSLLLNTLQMNFLKGRVDETFLMLVGVAIVAPIVEELLKCAGLLFVSGHHEFDDELTGMLLGFSIGLGFSFVENWFYFASKTNPFESGFLQWGIVILYRSFFNSMAHGCFTAAAGGIVGYVKSHPRIRGFSNFAIIPAVICSIMLHIVFNLSALLDAFVIAKQNIAVFIFNPMLVIALAAAFIIAVLFAELDRSRMLAKGGGGAASAK